MIMKIRREESSNTGDENREDDRIEKTGKDGDVDVRNRKNNINSTRSL